MTARTHTPGTLIPCRSHEDHTGPYWDIEEEERAHYDARPFVKLVTSDGVTVANAHDLFEFGPGDAERLALCWNALEPFDDATVAHLAGWLARYNADELNEMMDQE
jgi:hypothetical protein